MAKGTQIAQAYVRIIPTTEGISDNIKSSLDGVENQFSKVGDLSGIAFGAAAGIAIEKAVSLAVESALKIFKQSIESAAEFEQLFGGSEKIFSNLDPTEILTDAKNAYKDLGLSINEYLAKINDVGATFKSTMGDEAGYEAAKRGLIAISDYASGTGKSVDELSQKFTMITRSTSSYQSIADQFSGILPATSNAFLEQAKAAGVLKDGYKSLTEVPIDEYQKAVVAMLEQGVAALNLTGNTATEASDTLSGSFTQMKKAWDNLVTSFATADVDTNAMTENFINAFKDFILNLAPVIQEMSPALVEAFSTMMVELAPVLADLFIKVLIEAFKKMPEITARQVDSITKVIYNKFNSENPFDLLVELYVRSWSKLLSNASDGAINLMKILDAILWVKDNVNGLSNAFSKLFDLINRLNTISNIAFKGIVDAIINTVNVFIGFFSEVQSAGYNAFNSLLNIAKNTVTEIMSALQGISFGEGFSIEKITDAFSNIKNIIQKALNDALNVVKGWSSDLLDAGRNAVEQFMQGVANAIQDAVNSLKSIGANMAQGLIDGFVDRFNAIKTKVINTVEKLVDSIKDALDINSPSRVMRDEVGYFMAKGLEVGWSNEMQKFNARVESDINTDFTLAQNKMLSSIDRSPVGSATDNTQSLVNGIVSALSGVTIQNNVKLEGDAGKLFRSVQEQNKTFKNQTGRSAFA